MPETTSREDQFLGQMVLLEDLAHYATSGDLRPTVQELGDDVVKRLSDADGRVRAQKWLKSYAQPLRLLKEFRDKSLEGEPTTESDLRDALEAIETVITGLSKRLQL